MRTEKEIKDMINATETIGNFNEFCNNHNGIEYKGEESEVDFPLIRMILLWVLNTQNQNKKNEVGK